MLSPNQVRIAQTPHGKLNLYQLLFVNALNGLCANERYSGNDYLLMHLPSKAHELAMKSIRLMDDQPEELTKSEI